MKLEEGKTYAHSDGDWLAVTEALRPDDILEVTMGRGAWESFVVVRLAPREPEWDGAYLVIDRGGDAWVRDGSRYGQIHTVTRACAADVEDKYGPCLPLIDADGHVVIPTVMAVNGVTEEDLHDSARRYASAPFRVGAALKALGGKHA